MNRQKNNQGFTLIEVMVALFILTVGMLGSTAMMLRTQQQAEETSIETSAAQRATNIAELLRANISSVSNMSGQPKVAFPLTVTSGGTAPACSSTVAGCNGAEMITLMNYFIGMELENFLPEENAQVIISKLSGSDDDPVLKVDVSWEKLVETDGTAVTQTSTLIFQP